MTKCWAPLFDQANFKLPKNIIQKDLENSIEPDKLCYLELEFREIELIKYDLESALKDTLMSWRRTQVNYLK